MFITGTSFHEKDSGVRGSWVQDLLISKEFTRPHESPWPFDPSELLFKDAEQFIESIKEEINLLVSTPAS